MNKREFNYNTEQEIILNCIRLGKVLAKKYSDRTGVPFSDLFSVVNYNIHKILPRLDKQKNPSSFITKSLSGYILNYLRDESRPIHIPRKLIDNYLKNEQRKNYFTEECESYNPQPSLRSHYEVLFEDIQDHADIVGTSESTNFFNEIYEILDPGEIRLLRLYYIDKWPLEKIGQSYALTADNVERLIEKLAKKIKHLGAYLE